MSPTGREVFARQVVHIDIEPLSDRPLEAEATILALPDLRVVWSRSATPACWKRSSELLTDGDDDFTLLINLEGAVLGSQLGRDVEIQAGEGISILHSEPAAMRFNRLSHLAMIVPRAALLPLVGDVDATVTHRVPRGTDALRLLGGYLGALRKNSRIPDATPWVSWWRLTSTI